MSTTVRPVRPFDRVFSPFDLFERELFRPTARTTATDASAPTDVWETDEGLEVTVDLPGLADTDVAVSVADDVLTIRAERKSVAKEGAKPHLRERKPHAFARQFSFGQPIDADAVRASMKNGVLTVTVQKSKAQGARQIPVKGE